jgi:quercetin dioxygenase-like cupin family protein
MISKSLFGVACLTAASAMSPALAADHAHADGKSPAVILHRPSDAKFMAVPGVPECTTLAPLHGDMSKGPATMMVRMTAGCMVPYHWHTPSEEMIVMQGTALSQMRGERPVVLKVGAYTQLPSPHVHRFRCTSKVDCLFFLVADAAFDIHFVDDAGKEISTEAALAAALKDSGKQW